MIVSYIRYDHRLRLALWIGRIVAAIHVVRPLSYRTCDLRSWIGPQATRFWPSSATLVYTVPFLHGTLTLRCLQKEISRLMRRCPTLSNRILSSDKTEWWFISATLCRWRRCFPWLSSYGSWHAYEKKKWFDAVSQGFRKSIWHVKIFLHQFSKVFFGKSGK